MIPTIHVRNRGTILRVALACLPLALTASWPEPIAANNPTCCGALAPDDPSATNAAATCVGAADCRACKNCSSCRWCTSGGTCGVCAPRKSTPPTPAPSRPPAPAFPKEPAAAATTRQRLAATEDGISAHFSPNGGCTAAIVRAISGARRSVEVIAHRLNSPTIVDALLGARGRGIEVTIVLDRAQQADVESDATTFARAGCTVLIDAQHAALRSHVMLIDGSDVLTGSFSYTVAAELTDAENLLVVRGKPTIAQAYAAEFAMHAAHATPYVPPPPTDRRE